MSVVVETDVLIVGAGPTGLTLANLLADHGVRTMLVEKNDSTSDEPRAISITDESLRVLQQIGTLAAAEQDMLLDTGARYYGRGGRLLADVRPGTPRLGHPRKSQFDQPALDAELLNSARKWPDLSLHFGTEAFSVESHADHVDVTVLTDDERKVIRASWLVACDGGRSPIRSQLSVPMEGTTQPERWLVVDILNAPPRGHYAEFHCNAVRPCVVVPGVKGRCRFEFMLFEDEDADELTRPEAIEALVRPYLTSGPLGPENIRRAAVYVAHQRVALSYGQGRIVLAGDAAHMMPPFAGQGLNAGIRDAANLAWKIAAAVKGAGTDELVATYERERRPHVVQMVNLSRRIGSVVMSTSGLKTRLRDALLSATRIVPPLRRWIVDMKFLKQPHFDDGCVVAPAKNIPRPIADLVGRSLPQPTVRVGSGEPVLLDSVLGAGWSAIRTTDSATVLQVARFEDGSWGTWTQVQESAGTLAAENGSYTILVRPDKYVAAAVEAGAERGVFEGLGHLVPGLGQDWPAPSKRAGTSTAAPKLTGA